MKTHSRVSVVLANWNGAHFLDEAIESVVRQNFGDWELIAVETGSIDGSREILTRWEQRECRIKSIIIPERLPYPTAINIGLAQAKGEFIARIESDDVWLPERLRDKSPLWMSRPMSG